MASSCCVNGFEWNGTPTGQESTLAGNNVYVTGSNSEVAILVITGLYGWKFVNERLLADHYAREVDATVYVPDFFGGEVIPSDFITQGAWDKIDIQGFQARNGKETRWPEIKAAAEAIRVKHERVGVIGTCWGGWASFQLGSKAHSPRLVDCVSTAHPTWLTNEDMDNIGVPVQIVAPEIDPVFSPDLKAYANTVIPTRGVPYDYQYFPGVDHGFASRGNPDDVKDQRAMVRAKNVMVGWMKEWLHGGLQW